MDKESKEFYVDTVRTIRDGDPVELFKKELASLTRENPPHPAMGFFELAARYGAGIGIGNTNTKDENLIIYIQLDFHDFVDDSSN